METADIPVWNGEYDTSWFDADGTEFHLTTPEQYAGFVKLQNQGVCKKGQTFYLDTDIDFNGRSIATISTFSGTLDGNGYAFRNFPNTMIGTLTGTVRNLSVEFMVESMSFESSSNVFVGLLCNINAGTIKNCHLFGKVTSLSMKMGTGGAYGCFGFVCGSNTGTIQGCTNAAKIVSFTSLDDLGTYYFGGICGQGIMGSISECANAGYLDVFKEKDGVTLVGGICGAGDGTLAISKCKNIGNISGMFCGGIAG